MIMAVIDEIRFKQDNDRHTINYADHAKTVAQNKYEEGINRYKAVIAEDIDSAVVMLREQIVEMLDTMSAHAIRKTVLNASDFGFSINYNTVDNGRVWSSFSGGLMTEFPVLAPPDETDI